MRQEKNLQGFFEKSGPERAGLEKKPSGFFELLQSRYYYNIKCILVEQGKISGLLEPVAERG